MARTGPQKYPPASQQYFYQGRYPGNPMESNVGVIHTTEGRTLPSYDGGASAPNFTALPDIPNRKLRWYQHYDFDQSSRALVNAAGGVETNTANAVQVELVGTCDERKSVTWDGKRAGVDYLFWPDAPDWALAELALFVKWARDNHGVKAQSTVTWKPYNKGQVGGSYGANGVRLTGAQWGRYYGWLGHQHVPENDHGDPGDLDFARVLEHVNGTAQPPQTGTSMTKPNRLSVRRDENITLFPGTPVQLYWTTEFQDDANGHADNGKTLATNVAYSAVITPKVLGLAHGDHFEVYAVEEDQNGTRTGTGRPSQVWGQDMGQHSIEVNMAYNGIVGQRLSFEIVNRGDSEITLTEIQGVIFSWPNS